MVEFALMLPVFMILIFGGITAALTYTHKAEVSHAVRDGARYGATVLGPVRHHRGLWEPELGGTRAVRDRAALRRDTVDVPDLRRVGDGFWRRVRQAGWRLFDRHNSTFPTTGCFNDGNVISGTRVHVSRYEAASKINLVFTTLSITVSSKGTARYEQ